MSQKQAVTFSLQSEKQNHLTTPIPCPKLCLFLTRQPEKRLLWMFN